MTPSQSVLRPLFLPGNQLASHMLVSCDSPVLDIEPGTCLIYSSQTCNYNAPHEILPCGGRPPRYPIA